MTRIMIDFLDLPNKRSKFGTGAAAVEMIRTKGNVFTGNQASYLLRNRTDNSAEIKRRPTGRPAGYKNAEIMTPFVRTKWTLHAHIFLFCELPRVFYRNKGYARRRRKTVCRTLWKLARIPLSKGKKINAKAKRSLDVYYRASTVSSA